MFICECSRRFRVQDARLTIGPCACRALAGPLEPAPAQQRFRAHSAPTSTHATPRNSHEKLRTPLNELVGWGNATSGVSAGAESRGDATETTVEEPGDGRHGRERSAVSGQALRRRFAGRRRHLSLCSRPPHPQRHAGCASREPTSRARPRCAACVGITSTECSACRQELKLGRAARQLAAHQRAAGAAMRVP